jgi:dephospho-CoA kinase
MYKQNLAVIGKMGAGKTAVTDLIVPYGYTKGILSYPLKMAAIEIWGGVMKMDRDKGIALGKFIQQTDPQALVKAWQRRSAEQKPPFVVEAPRYPSDYDGLSWLGFRFIEVKASDEVRVDRLQRAGHGRLTDVSQLEDETETALDDRSLYPVDYTITNDGTEEQLAEKVLRIVQKEEARV